MCCCWLHTAVITLMSHETQTASVSHSLTALRTSMNYCVNYCAMSYLGFEVYTRIHLSMSLPLTDPQGQAVLETDGPRGQRYDHMRLSAVIGQVSLWLDDDGARKLGVCETHYVDLAASWCGRCSWEAAQCWHYLCELTGTSTRAHCCGGGLCTNCHFLHNRTTKGCRKWEGNDIFPAIMFKEMKHISHLRCIPTLTPVLSPDYRIKFKIIQLTCKSITGSPILTLWNYSPTSSSKERDVFWKHRYTGGRQMF